MDRNIDAEFGKLAAAGVNRVRAQHDALGDRFEDLERQKESAKTPEEIERIEKQKLVVQAELQALQAKEQAAFEKPWNELMKQYERGTWNASSAAIGVAPVFFSETGSYSDLDSDGYAVYGTLAYGFDGFKQRTADNRESLGWLGKYTQILLHARYTENEMEALPEGAGFRKQNTTIYGGQFRIQGPKIWSDDGGDLVFSLEGSNVSKDFAEGGNEDVTRYAGGFEVKPLKNSGFTLKAVVGGQSGGSDSDSGFVATTLNWALE
jgi:hypothetical protein